MRVINNTININILSKAIMGAAHFHDFFATIHVPQRQFNETNDFINYKILSTISLILFNYLMLIKYTYK